MKKGDFIWSGVFICIIVVLVILSSREVFMEVIGVYLYIGGFLKFVVLVIMGDLFGVRILYKDWKILVGVFYRVIVWGIIGVVIIYGMLIYLLGVG